MVKILERGFTVFPLLTRFFMIASVQEDEARLQTNDESSSTETTIYGTRWASRDIPR
jgi:hypothetical protein